MVNTIQQDLIINSECYFLAIKAFAGTGKTTILKKFAERRISKKILYIAYNNETARKAREIFPSNVVCKTAHSLAYEKFGYQLRNKLNKNSSLPFKPETIRKLFGLKRNTKSIKLSKEIKSIIEEYCYSDFDKIDDVIPLNSESEIREVLSMFCNTVWNEMTDPKSKFPCIPDVYLKQYKLTNPILKYDYILFDEAQDANPLILELILSQRKFKTKLVFVADEHQSIYQFRGAKNALEEIYPDEELYLTKSFRFGKNIAFVANSILKTLKNENNSLEGFDEISDKIGEVDKNELFAVISRTNANLFLSAISAYEKGYKIHFVGGFENYNFKKILDIERLYLNKKESIRDSYIKSFDDFDDYKLTASYTNDKEMLYYIKVVENYSGRLKDLIIGIKNSSVDINYAGIILTTVHKSKGLEFKQVVLSNDFPSFINKNNEIDYKKLKIEEINILYVAVTRAINVLKPNKQLEIIIDYYKKNIENVVNYNNKNNNNQKTFISKIKNKY